MPVSLTGHVERELWPSLKTITIFCDINTFIIIIVKLNIVNMFLIK